MTENIPHPLHEGIYGEQNYIVIYS